jgi:anti-sigma B factor antagonist
MHPFTESHSRSTAGLPGTFETDVVIEDTTRCRLRARGELDLSSAPGLAAALHEQLGRGRRHLRLDLSQVTFCDTTGLAVLVDAHHEFRSRRGSLTLVGIGARMRRLLALTGTDRVLDVDTDDERDASAIAAPADRPSTLRDRIPRPLVRVRRPA